MKTDLEIKIIPDCYRTLWPEHLDKMMPVRQAGMLACSLLQKYIYRHSNVPTLHTRRQEMHSLALFPCSYTDEAGLIGELSNALHLRVYTDEMLFSDISDQFGVHIEKLKKILFRTSPDLNRYKLKKEKYINLLRCSLEARRKLSPGGCIYYGVHTSLLDTESDHVLKVLVFDDEQGRIRRAMQQDGLSEDAAREHIWRHDEKVSGWTQFLFNEQAYAHSLHDLIISWKNNSLLNITGEIVERFQRVSVSFHPGQRSYAPPLSPMHLYAK